MTRYTVDHELVAVHGQTPPLGPDPVYVFSEERIVVLRRADVRALASKSGPVYRIEGGEAWTVPTGRVFIRFADGESIEAHRAELESAGFSIEKAPAYAPHAAWITPRSGDIGDALRGLGHLGALPGVHAVEPEMLLPRGFR